MLTKQCDIDQVNQCWTWGLCLRLAGNLLWCPELNGKSTMTNANRSKKYWFQGNIHPYSGPSHGVSHAELQDLNSRQIKLLPGSLHSFQNNYENKMCFCFQVYGYRQNLNQNHPSSPAEQFIVALKSLLAKGKAFSSTSWLATPH